MITEEDINYWRAELAEGRPVVHRIGKEDYILVPGVRRMFIGGHRCGVFIDRNTPANKFELVKGGFRLDIADLLLTMLTRLTQAPEGIEKTPQRPAIEHKKED